MKDFITINNILDKTFFYISAYTTLMGDNTSAKNIVTLQMEDMGMKGSFLYKLVNKSKKLSCPISGTRIKKSSPPYRIS